ncbi:MAG: hypothetical protein U7M05_07465 [Candidatus Igneacidithiobacillus chanchocoensis]
MNGLGTGRWGRVLGLLLWGLVFALAGCGLEESPDMGPIKPLPIPAEPTSLNAHPANGAIWQP